MGAIVQYEITESEFGLENRVENPRILLKKPHTATLPGGTTVALPAETKLSEQDDGAEGGV